MGQRSQIYVRCKKEGKNYLTANYYQWNFGERMISRCRHGLEWIKMYLDDGFDWYLTTETTKLSRIFDVNFDMKDIVLSCDIIKEWEDYCLEENFNEQVFFCQDNNDGKLLIDIDGKIVKYAFLDGDANTEKIMTAAQYMNWDHKGWRKSEYIEDEQKALCESNIKEIKKLATLMTKEEVEDFLNCKYVNESMHEDVVRTRIVMGALNVEKEDALKIIEHLTKQDCLDWIDNYNEEHRNNEPLTDVHYERNFEEMIDWQYDDAKPSEMFGISSNIEDHEEMLEISNGIIFWYGLV